MKNLMFVIFILGICGTCFADTYAVEKPDGSVSIANYFENSSDSVEKFMDDSGFAGLPFYKIGPSTLPSREDRDFWQVKDGKVSVNEVKKQAYIDQLAIKKQKKLAVIQKIGITEKEYSELTDKSVKVEADSL
jgi:hypothetical protein